MPTYQYACTECGHDFETVQSFSDDSLTECPECTGKLRKVFNAVGIVFKGSGFYRTDSRSAPGEAAKGESGGDKATDGAKDGVKDGAKDNGKGSKDGKEAKPAKPAAKDGGGSAGSSAGIGSTSSGSSGSAKASSSTKGSAA